MCNNKIKTEISSVRHYFVVILGTVGPRVNSLTVAGWNKMGMKLSGGSQSWKTPAYGGRSFKASKFRENSIFDAVYIETRLGYIELLITKLEFALELLYSPLWS